MQTFLPYASFAESFYVLDSKRLGKQRVEASQIISALLHRPRKDGKSYKGWLNHPIVVMWRNHIPALQYYYNMCVASWIARGYKNNMEFEIITEPVVMPPWLGDRQFHLSHQANLMRKLPEYYHLFNWGVDPELPYRWQDANGDWYSMKSGSGDRQYDEVDYRFSTIPV